MNVTFWSGVSTDTGGPNGTDPLGNGSFVGNSSGDSLDEYIFDNLSVRVFFYISYTIVFCLCFFGNLTVLLVVGHQWRTRSVTMFCMGNLAFANFCVGIFCVYQNLSTFITENNWKSRKEKFECLRLLNFSWAFGRLLCKMYYFTNGMSHTASILILVVICVERYLSILNPFRGRRVLTIQRLKLILVIVWLISAAICSPRLYYITTFEAPLLTGSEEDFEVICAPKRTLYNSRTADMVYFFLLFLMPLLVMTVLYARIGAVIWKTSATLQESPPQQPTQTTPGVSDQIYTVAACDLAYFPRVPHNSIATSATQSSTSTRRSTNDPALQSSSSSTASTHSKQRGGCRKCKRQEGDQNVDVCKQCRFYYRNEIRRLNLATDRTPHRYHTGLANGVLPTSISGPQLIQVKDERRGKVLRSRQAVIRMLIVLVVSFAVCNFPYHLRKIFQYYVSNYNIGSYFNQIFTPLTFLLMYTNCAINPILYAFMSKQFRVGLRELVDCKGRRSRANNGRRRLSV